MTVGAAGGRKPRALVAGLLGVVAVIALVVGVVGAQARALVTSTDAYLAVAGPALEDPELRAAAADAVAARVVAVVPEGSLTAWLPDDAGSAAGTLARAALTALVRDATARVLASDAAAGLWRGANRVLHQQVSATLQGRDGAVVVTRGGPADGVTGETDGAIVALDLTAVWDRARGELAELGVPSALLPERSVLVDVAGSDAGAAVLRVQHATSWLLVLPFAAAGTAVVAGAGAVLLARRRRRAGVLLGLGTATTAALAIAVLTLLVPTGAHDVVGLLVAGVAERAAAGVLGWLWWLLAAGLAATLAVVAPRVHRRVARPRSGG
ncbi:hypothetical protein C8046_01300 [Serinibacter arcticus]|uniref:Integral membrane protein n=1 Tax=Serinibacter arcticus TaxID=1655435 RepID=A0A2U1ZRH8_9MICO|nr:hypothetical protein [Serinibacter arcticus]PWD49550.1 hypothetical protein C8046_01300 [Serinibacter arcticus]